MTKLLMAGVAATALLLTGQAYAQVKIDMSRVTCSQYLELPEDDAKIFSAWMSGYFNQKAGYSAIDVENYTKNVANMKEWCAQNKSATVMAALQRFTAPKK